MNFFNPNSSKKEMITSVNKELTDALNEEFNKSHDEMKQTLLANGIKPDEVDKMLEIIKQKTQIRMIKEFKEQLRLKVQNRPQEAQHHNASVTIGLQPK